MPEGMESPILTDYRQTDWKRRNRRTSRWCHCGTRWTCSCVNGLCPVFFLTSLSLTHILHPNIFSALSLPASNSSHFSLYHFSISFTLSDKSPFTLTSQSDSITANRHRPSDQYKEQHIQEQTNILAHTHTHSVNGPQWMLGKNPHNGNIK